MPHQKQKKVMMSVPLFKVDCSNTKINLLKRRKKQLDVKTKFRKILPYIPINIISDGGWLHDTHIQVLC